MSQQASPNLPPELWASVFALLAVSWPPGWHKRERGEDEITTVGLGWMTVAHICRQWRFIILGLARLWADDILSFVNVEAIYTFKARANNLPLNLDIDRLIAGSRGRDISSAIDMICGDTDFFHARSIKCSLGLDDAVITQEDYSSNGTLGTDAWMRILEWQEVFPALASLTLPWTYHDLTFPIIVANNLASLHLIGVRVARYFDSVRPIYRGYRPERETERDRVGDLANFLQFLKPLVKLDTLVLVRGAFAILPHDELDEADLSSTPQPVPVQFPNLVNVRLTTRNVRAIQDMMTHIVTPTKWVINTYARPGHELSYFTDPHVNVLDVITIDDSPRMLFITFSLDNNPHNSVRAPSPLDHDFAREAISTRRLNLHVGKDHITFAFSFTRPHFGGFEKTCRKLIINRLSRFFDDRDPPEFKPRMTADWLYLQALRTPLENVELNDNSRVREILRNLRAPVHLTLHFPYGSPGNRGISELASIVDDWRSSENVDIDISLTGTKSSTSNESLPSTLHDVDDRRE